MIARYARTVLLTLALVATSAGTAHAATTTRVNETAPLALPSLDEAGALSARKRLELASKLMVSKVLEERQLAFHLLLPMAARGDRDAIRLLAKGVGRYPDTIGTEIAAAAKPFVREALAGSTSAVYAIARMYETGIGLSKDAEQAMRWYRWAAVKGQGTAIERLALSLTTGEFGARDVDQAHRWALKLDLDRRASLLQAMAAILYESSNADDAAVADAYVAEALGAPAPAAVAAAGLALKSSRSDTLIASARQYLEISLSMGDAGAITVLASTSTGASPELLQNVVQLLGPLVSKGNQGAIDQLIYLLRVQSLSPTTAQQAVTSLTVAADTGSVAAAKAVAAALTLGSGATLSFEGAAKYLKIAATGGDADAAYQLGMLYFSGMGLEVDQAEGRKWLEKSAASGSKLAVAVLQTL